jgi:IS5 family transposase
LNSKAGGFGIVVNQDLYRQTLEEMVDPRHPLVVLAGRIPWDELEARIAPLIVRNLRSSRTVPHIWTPPFCKLFRFDVSRSSYAVAPIYSAFGEILGDLWPRWISACFHPYQDTGPDDL